MTRLPKTLLLWVISAAIPLASLELFGFALTKMRADLFDQRERILSTLQPEEFERFKDLVASDTLGWDNPAGRTREIPDCRGDRISYSYDQNRIRKHGAGRSLDAAVVVAGDSYTHGDEVADDDTFPAALERILGVSVANLGVGGYDPLQALMKIEGLIDRFPKASVIVLGIMYENTHRLLNSYRPVYEPSTGIKFGLKPYLENGEFRSLVSGHPFQSFHNMLAAANRAFDNDYWSRPRTQFPYSFALIQLVLSPALWDQLLTKVSITFNIPQYYFFHHLPSVRRGLSTIYGRVLDLTRSRNLQAVIVFIPADRRDINSGLVAISAATDAQRNGITFINVGRDFDWSHYKKPGCHPSADGYRMIANSIADVVRPMLTQSHPRPLP